MKRALLLLALPALAAAQGIDPRGLRVQDEGVSKGWVGTLNFTGAGVTCSVAGSRATCNVTSGGGSGLPADPAACGAGTYVTDQNASGVLTCAQVGYGQLSGVPGSFTPAAHTHPGGDVTSSVASATSATSASTASALAGTPTLCNAGEAARGILASGNATGCWTPSAGGGAPGGSGSELQIRAGPTTFGAYGGASCTAGNAIRVLSAAGAATCEAIPAAYTLPDAAAAVKGGIQLAGDLGGTAASPSVGDDSHAHTTTTISALDAGDVTTGTLAGARGGGGAALPTCSGTDKLTSNGTNWSCATDQTSAGGATVTKLASAWASSGTINVQGIIGTGTVPMTSPTIAANASFRADCLIATTRPSTSNGPRYGVTSSQTLTRVGLRAEIFLAGTAPAFTQNLQVVRAVTSGTCTNCTAAITASTLAVVGEDVITITGQMGATPGTVSLQMAPSAGAAVTAQPGSSCVWY